MVSVVTWWRSVEPAEIRARLTDVNDGIIAVAGMGLGLAGAEVNRTTAIAVVVLSSVVGAMSVFGMELGETFGEREAVAAIAESERRLIELSPDEELAELIEAFESKGVSPATARAVAEELSAADALSAQLEIEYGIRGFTSASEALREAVLAGLAFLAGALVPLVATILVPWDTREELVLLISVLSLVGTSVVLSRRGMSRIGSTVARSVVVGLGALGISYVLGDWLI